MKLYYAPGACSLSPHIVLLEAGLSFTMEKVDLGAKKTASGGDYLALNPKGSVPLLELDDGRRLTEGPAIVQYIADQTADSGLAPRAGTFERYQLMELLNYVTSELHKGFSPLFNPKLTLDWKAVVLENLDKRFTWLDGQLGKKPYLMGDTFTVADAYLFTVLRWSNVVGVDLGKHPVLTAYVARVMSRPKVHAALEAEGLLK